MSDFMAQVEQEISEDRELARLVSQEELIGDITELILEKLEDKGMVRSDLATILDTSKSHVTQLLRGSRNMTLRTVSDIFFALGYKVMVDAVVKGSHGRRYDSETWKQCVGIPRIPGWTSHGVGMGEREAERLLAA